MDQADEFFVTGLEKYLDAKAAVNLYEREVQQRVKKSSANTSWNSKNCSMGIPC
jgi:hypothetical protein